MRYFFKKNHDGKENILSSSWFTTTLFLLILTFILFNFNFDVFNAGAATGPVNGQGTPGHIAEWVPTIAQSSISNLTVQVTDPNYCAVGVHATVSGTYVNSLGNSANAYEIQIDDDNDPTTGQPEWESGTVTSPIPNGGTFSGTTTTCNPANPITSPQLACRMTWNTVYKAWARVQDSVGNWSVWTLMNTFCNGASCNTASSWTTPVHAYPQTLFTFSPANPAINTPVSFTDGTTFYGAATPHTWVWDFDYPSGPDTTITTATAANGNTTHTYSTTGTYTIQLKATDDIGQTCSYQTSSPIGVQNILPKWREVAPL